MRIATWNINSLRLRIGLLEKFCERFLPDIVCIQETKVIDELFPQQLLEAMGYRYMSFVGQKSYNGVAIISKIPITSSFSLKFYNDDARHISAKINDIEVHNFYIPAGGDEPDIKINPKFKHKLEYISMVQTWFTENRNKNTDKIILVGDLNIAPLEHDVWSSNQLKNVVSHTDIERKLLQDLLTSFDFIDVARKFIPIDQKLYSWWSYRNKDWKKSNRGRRLDSIWITRNLDAIAKNITFYNEFREEERPSDHIPIILETT